MKLYFIALVPPSEIEGELKSLKEKLRDRYGLKHALKLPAHITLQKPFRIAEEEEEGLLKALASFAEKQERVSIELKDFDVFPPRIIYVKVADHRPVRLFFEKLQDVLSTVLSVEQLMGKERFHPHVTIASRDLKKELFAWVWKEIKDCTFEASWEAQNLMLFKYDGKFWNIHSVFPMEKV